MEITNITATDLQDDIVGPIIMEEYRKQVTKRMKDEKYSKVIPGYVRSIFQSFESYLRIEIELVEDDVRLVPEEYVSCFVTYELQPVVYTFKDLSQVLFNILQSGYPGPKNVTDFEFDDISMKTKLVVRDGVIAIRFDEKPFFNKIVGFEPHWDYKH